MDKKTVIIFGGAGFIGTHLARYLAGNSFSGKIYCVDIEKPRINLAAVEYIWHDIRKPFTLDLKGIETIYNLAAVHTTPGHPDSEYFRTNIRGAENICDFARRANINTIVFTSSISPYGPSEELKKETDLPQPKSAYGVSKLVAEYIHRCWLAESAQRKLIIVRPGVVFGQGEGGNFTRLYNSMKKRCFFYPSRKDTKKACIYVKDMVRALYEMPKSDARFQLYNMCYAESPAIAEILRIISEVTGVPQGELVVPGWLLKTVAGIYYVSFRLFGKKTGIHPARVAKLMLSTNISGEKLAGSPYAIQFLLKEAIRDWYQDCNMQGLF